MKSKKFLIAIALVVTTSNVSLADGLIKRIANDCANHSLSACKQGRSESCRIHSPYRNKQNCGWFSFRTGLELHQSGDYLAAKNAYKQAIDYDVVDAQKAMGVLCTQQPWVCSKR